MSQQEKPVIFLGDSLKRLRDFPTDAKQEAGFQIGLLQQGKMPDDFKIMPTVGKGAYEIRVNEGGGIFRVFYVANRGDAIYVLHCFQKKTQKTAQKDIALGQQRYQELPP